MVLIMQVEVPDERELGNRQPPQVFVARRLGVPILGGDIPGASTAGPLAIRSDVVFFAG